MYLTNVWEIATNDEVEEFVDALYAYQDKYQIRPMAKIIRWLKKTWGVNISLSAMYSWKRGTHRPSKLKIEYLTQILREEV